MVNDLLIPVVRDGKNPVPWARVDKEFFFEGHTIYREGMHFQQLPHRHLSEKISLLASYVISSFSLFSKKSRRRSTVDFHLLRIAGMTDKYGRLLIFRINRFMVPKKSMYMNYMVGMVRFSVLFY